MEISRRRRAGDVPFYEEQQKVTKDEGLSRGKWREEEESESLKVEGREEVPSDQ